MAAFHDGPDHRNLSNRKAVVAARRAVRAHHGVVTVGDVMAGTGLGEVDAEAALKTLLTFHPAVLEVRDDGTLIYRFDSTSLVKRRTEQIADAAVRLMVGALLTAAKIAIMLTLAGYSVVFILASVALAIAALISAEGDGAEGAFELLLLPIRLVGDFLLYAPDWLFWGTTHEPQQRVRVRGERVPEYEKIFRYLFGPPEPRLREAQVAAQRAQLMRASGGVVTVADVIGATGKNKTEAEHELAALVGRLGGDVKATEAGEVLYVFNELMRRADDDGIAAYAAGARYEGRRALTGNSREANTVIVILALITMAGGLAGDAIFERLGILGLLPQLLGSWIPVTLGASFLLLPLLRSPRLARENSRRALRDARRALVQLHEQAADSQTLAEWTAAIRSQTSSGDDAVIEHAFRDLGSDFGAEIEARAETGELRYRFPAIHEALRAGRDARMEYAERFSIDEEIAYSTAD